MNDYSDSTDRSVGELTLFGLAFVGFICGAAGVVVASLFLTLMGGGLLLLSVGALSLCSAD